MDCDSDAAADSASEFAYEDQDVEFQLSDGGDDDQMIIETPEVRKSPVVVMNRPDLEERQKRCIQDAAELLDLTRQESFVLLRAHSWDLAQLQELWFQNDAKVRKACGLGCVGPGGSTSSSALTQPGGKACIICREPRDTSDWESLDCGHFYCKECWATYLRTKVDSGKASIQSRCPEHQCGRVVPDEFFQAYVDKERYEKYREWYVQSYVDDNPSVKWCTNPSGCNKACRYSGAGGQRFMEIQCTCGFFWCWQCGEESHRPADCKTVNSWNVKNSAESENIGWIRANTKKCPKCHKPIEKNQGCNHMVCSKNGGCGHEFCWLCLGEWAAHGTSTGGYYQCNIYDKQSKEGTHAEEEKSRIKAKHALDKYMFYFERFMDHERGMKLTIKQEVEIEKHVQTLHDLHGFEVIELQFLYDALRQVRSCRRVLKWTYVYGYYLEDSGPEKALFEHLQKQLEEKTDRLHEFLEKDLEVKIQAPLSDVPAEKANTHTLFMEFRSTVTNFTLVTQNWLQKILADVGIGSADGLGLTGSPSIGPAADPSMGSALPRASVSPATARKRSSSAASAPSGSRR